MVEYTQTQPILLLIIFNLQLWCHKNFIIISNYILNWKVVCSHWHFLWMELQQPLIRPVYELVYYVPQ